MTNAVAARPSDKRRAELREADASLGEKGIPIVSNFFPIERYYDAARKVLASFHIAYDKRHLDDAYVYGKRFASFSLDALPMHNYYKSPKYKNMRSENSLEMTNVILKLEQIAKWMDEEEVKREKEMRRAVEEMKRREEEREARRYKEFQDRVNQQKKASGQAKGNVERSALNKLELLIDSRPGAPSDKPSQSRGGLRTVSSTDESSLEDFGEDSGHAKIDFEFDNHATEAHRMRNPKQHIALGAHTKQHVGPSNSTSESSESDKRSINDMAKSFQKQKYGVSLQSRRSSSGNDVSTGRESDHAHRRHESRRNSGSDDGTSHRSVGSNNMDETTRVRHSHRRDDDDDASGSRSGQSRRRSNESYTPQSSRHSRSNRRSSHDRGSEEPLPPPIPPPTVSTDAIPPPPSYNAAVAEKLRDPRARHPNGDHGVSRQRLAISQSNGVPNQRPVTINPSSEPTYCNRDKERQMRSMRNSEIVPMRKIRENNISDYKRMKQERKIEVFGINTFQGRYSNSTNGCAVISPLVVSRHLSNASSVPDQGIVDVIDAQCVPLLREIRGKLGLGGDALIIPSDVHDHLVDHKYLSQEGFIGVIGGNIMDHGPVSEFIKMIDQGDEKGSHKEKKTGATLFFHEHVVSIVKVPSGQGRFCFDLIDSMPGLIDKSNRRMATRTRCRDILSFETLIRWYASVKFTESNCNWIDKNDWDETMAEIDPRVFQGFVWGETSAQ